MLGPFAFCALTFVPLAVALAWLAPRRGLALESAALAGLFVQSQFFLWDVGAFDGGAVDWGRHAGKGWMELGFWLLLLGVAWFRPYTVSRRAAFVALLVPLLASVSLAANYFDSAPYAERRITTLDEEAEILQMRTRILSFSRERNVLVIVLDALQSDLFNELASDPEVAAAMPPGLTFYRNAVSHYPVSQRSLPSILTSKTLPESTDMVRWQVEQMAQSVPARLARDRFDATLLSWTPFLLSCNSRMFGYSCLSMVAALGVLDLDSAQSQRDSDAVGNLRGLLGAASLRMSPYLAKSWLYNGGRWRLPGPYGVAAGEGGDTRIWLDARRDMRVLGELVAGASAASPRPTFKLFHFFGAHLPSTLDSECEWNGVETPDASGLDELMERLIAAGQPIANERSVVLEASKCLVLQVFRLLAKLDALGVYDESLIFIVADHGRNSMSVDLSAADPVLAGAASGTKGAGPSRGVPLVLAKRIAARHSCRMRR